MIPVALVLLPCLAAIGFTALTGSFALVKFSDFYFAAAGEAMDLPGRYRMLETIQAHASQFAQADVRGQPPPDQDSDGL